MNAPLADLPDAFQYDVFVACCECDQALTEEEVLLALRTADLKVVTRGDGKYGATVLDNLKNSVTQSRHTLAVITSSYLSDPLCQLLDNLAMHLDPAARAQRFIPLFFEPKGSAGRGSNVSLLIARLEGLELSDTGERAGAMNRLLAQLCGDRKILNQKSADSARRGVATLQHFVGTPEVKGRVEQFWNVFERACDQIELLTRDKQLHDDFGLAQNTFDLVLDRKRDLIKERSQGALEEGALDSAWERLEGTAEDLKTKLATAKAHACEYAAPSEPPPWVETLTMADDEMSEGIRNLDIELVKAALEAIAVVLQREPTRLNGSLKEKAKQLPLTELIKQQNDILAELRKLSFDEEAQKRIEDFAAGVKALELFQQNLQRLLHNHDELQSSEDQLQSLDHSESPEIAKIRQVWRFIAKPLRSLEQAGWITDFKLVEKMEGLESALAGYANAASDPKVARAIRSQYCKLRPAVRDGFSRTDADLLQLCDEISKLRQTTDQRLDVISNA